MLAYIRPSTQRTMQETGHPIRSCRASHDTVDAHAGAHPPLDDPNDAVDVDADVRCRGFQASTRILSCRASHDTVDAHAGAHPPLDDPNDATCVDTVDAHADAHPPLDEPNDATRVDTVDVDARFVARLLLGIR